MEFKILNQRGWILVQILLFALTGALLVLNMLESNWIQVRMNHYFKSSIVAKRAVLKKLTQYESEIPSICDKITWPLIQFVPDTYHENECEGISFYRIFTQVQVNDAQKQLESVFAVRCQRSHATAVSNDKTMVWYPNLNKKYLYRIEHPNILRKIEMKGDSLLWHEQSMTLSGRALSPPLVGRAPNEGAYIYLLIEDKNQYQLIAIWDDFRVFKGIIFSIPISEPLAYPSLRHDFLVLAWQNKINIYSAFNGTWLSQCHLSEQSKLSSQALKQIRFIEFHHGKMPWVEVGQDGCFVEIDKDRLGRRVLVDL